MLRATSLEDVPHGLRGGLREVVRGFVFAFDPEANVEADGFFHRR